MRGDSITGCELISRCLEAEGIRYVFTAHTERLHPLLDALEQKGDIRVVAARSETAATVMADGYVRRSRRVAAVLTDDNGAALSQVSGVTNAWADKIPLLSLSLSADSEPDFSKGYDRYRFDQGEVFQPVTQYRSKLESLSEAQSVFAEAVARSTSNKMGPCHVDIPARLLGETIDGRSAPDPGGFEERRIESVRMCGDGDAVERAAALIAGAERPLLFLGGGVHASGAHAEAAGLARGLGIPVATSMAGVGAFPLDDPLCLGGPSYTSGEVFHAAIKEADTVVAVGVSFGGLEGFGLPPLWSDAIRFIHIDVAPLQMGLNVHPEVAVLGDARTVLTQLAETLAGRGFTGRPEWGRWSARLAELKSGRARRLERNAMRRWPSMHQGRAAMELGRLVDRDDLLIVIDGGNTPLYATMYAPTIKPGQAFFPFGMAALGGGIPYAIGVQLASPDRRVLLVTGDGSFMYNVQELETIKRLGLPIMIAVNNDSAWNMIKAMQDSLFARNFVGTCLPDVDYSKIASGFGLHAERVSRPEEIAPAYERAVASGGPALIDAVTDSTNIPDSLLSFFLVEFEGAFAGISPTKLARSLWMMRDVGIHRMMYMSTYIRKALLKVFIPSGWGRSS